MLNYAPTHGQRQRQSASAAAAAASALHFASPKYKKKKKMLNKWEYKKQRQQWAGWGWGVGAPKGRGRAATATAIGNALLPHYVTKERQRGGERGRKGKANDQHTFQAAKRSAKGRGRGRGSQCRERTDDPRQQTRAGHERERARQTARAAEFNNLRRP